MTAAPLADTPKACIVCGKPIPPMRPTFVVTCGKVCMARRIEANRKRISAGGQEAVR